MEDELTPLIAERLARNIATLRNSFGNITSERRYVIRKLCGNTCKELASMANISTTSREKEACPEKPSLKVVAGDSASNRGLSRTG
jgi:hypothetical protein